MNTSTGAASRFPSLATSRNRGYVGRAVSVAVYLLETHGLRSERGKETREARRKRGSRSSALSSLLATGPVRCRYSSTPAEIGHEPELVFPNLAPSGSSSGRSSSRSR